MSIRNNIGSGPKKSLITPILCSRILAFLSLEKYFDVGTILQFIVQITSCYFTGRPSCPRIHSIITYYSRLLIKYLGT